MLPPTLRYPLFVPTKFVVDPVTVIVRWGFKSRLLGLLGWPNVTPVPLARVMELAAAPRAASDWIAKGELPSVKFQSVRKLPPEEASVTVPVPVPVTLM